ncbi:MAG: hypothetical protein ABI675_15190 [Chitinophagaceae bacterium]
MITIDNYFTKIISFDRTIFPDALNKGHEFVAKATNNGSSWTAYHSSEGIKKTVDLYLEKLNEFLKQSKKPEAKPAKKKEKEVKPKTEKQKSRKLTTKKKDSDETDTPEADTDGEIPPTAATLVERISEELKFIRRFINLNGKTKTKEQVLSFINSLQKAILEKRIRKTSQYADQIRLIQDKLINLYNSMKAKIRIELKPDTYDELKQLTGDQKILASVSFIKRYIGMNGKPGMKEKAKKLLEQINRAMDKGKVTDNDAYISEIHEIKKNLKSFTITKAKKSLEIERAELNGLEGILGGYSKKRILYDTDEKRMKAIRKKGNIITFKRPFYPTGTLNQGYTQIIVTGISKQKGAIKIEGYGYDSDWYKSVDDLLDAINWEWMESAHESDELGCNCNSGLSGLDEIPTVMNSMEFAKLQFDTIGLQGKWFELIGDPSRNFTAMVFGKPKMGKSYLCIDFAGYLARYHGKVLYVAKEEGLDMTLQKKLNEKNVKHPNLYVASVLPTDLSRYDFIFLDSVNRLGLKPEDLNNLKVRNPDKSFVFIFQSTKMGDFRGANSFQHDVDIVIEVPEKGKAVQMGRFNQGGEMDIFDLRKAA